MAAEVDGEDDDEEDDDVGRTVDWSSWEWADSSARVVVKWEYKVLRRLTSSSPRESKSSTQSSLGGGSGQLMQRMRAVTQYVVDVVSFPR